MNKRMVGIVSICNFGTKSEILTSPLDIISSGLPHLHLPVESYCPQHKLQIKISGIMMAFIIGGFKSLHPLHLDKQKILLPIAK
jgi:hypothetical protein